MKIIDLHQDLIPYEKYKNDAIVKDQTSWEDIEKSEIKIFLPTANSWDYLDWESKKPEPYLNDLISGIFLEYINYCKNSDIFEIIKNQKDFELVWENQKKKGIIMHLEGIDYFEDKKEYWDILDYWYKIGWRSIGIVWNIENHLAGGTNTPKIGLKDLGKKVLEWSIKKNMIIDYAHMNERTFWDVRKFLKDNFPNEYRKPVYVSHSAIRDFMDNDRNITLEQLSEIKKTNGVIGLFFSHKFLDNKNNTSIDDFINHIDYIKKEVGIDSVAIGTDLGGYMNKTVDGLARVKDLKNLEHKLVTRGYTDEEIKKIFYKNAYRVVKNTLPK